MLKLTPAITSNISSARKMAAVIWRKMAKKAYRDAFVSAHVSNTVASQITTLRQAKGWTQTELAERAGMRQSRISALEDPNNENFEAKTLLRLASALDVGVAIRFTSFSAIAHWASNITPQTLAVPSFDDDALEEPEEMDDERSSKANVLPQIGFRTESVPIGINNGIWIIDRPHSSAMRVIQ
jgi:HTH-type transcriptional regulator/antitoxin HipB